MRLPILESALILMALATLACGQPEGDEEPGPRAAVLERSPAQIAADGLSAVPTPEFAAARSRVADGVGKQRRGYARDFVVVGGRGAVLAHDLEFAAVRAAAAIALGTAIDPSREQDIVIAQEALDELVREMQRRVPGATRCADLGDKADDCATTLIIIEVKRSERTSVPALIDAAMSPATAASGDAGVPDARPASAAAVQIGCGDRSIVGAKLVEASVDKDQTWSGTILVRGSIRVTAGRLTIAPGTRVLFEPGSELDVGYNGTKPTLIADGTAAAPISFCGVRDEPGSWGKLRFRSAVAGESVLRNVLVANGGRDDAALQVDADMMVDNVQVHGSGQDGVWAADFKAGSRGLSVSGSGKLAVVLTASAAASDFPLGGTFTMNGRDVAALRFTSVDRDTTLHAIGVPYLQEATIRQTQGALRIEPGVEVRMASRSALLLGYNGGASEIHAEGRADAPIVFRGDEERPGYWDELRVYSAVRTTSGLRHVEIRHAGSEGSPALQISSPITIDHVSLRQNALGALIESNGLAPTSQDLTITETGDRPLSIAVGALTTLPSGVLSGNRVDEILVRSGSHDRGGVVRDLGVPYYIDGQLNVTGGELTVEPGVQFVFARGGVFSVGRNETTPRVVLRGAADKPIQFRGAMPVPGAWTGLRISATARMDCVFDQLVVAHAGTTNSGAIELYPAIPVTNTRISDSAGFGIRHRSAAIDYGASNMFTNVAQGATDTF